jgi:hypothetical protein
MILPPGQIALIIVSPLAIIGFFYCRRWESNDPKSPYTVAIRGFRQVMLISGLAGLFGLFRIWLMSQK